MALNINNTFGVGFGGLAKAQKSKNSALEKLSSGLRINKGADDPSGLLISELLRSQISGYQRALRNTQEANNVMSIAEGGLSSVSSMLTQMRGLAIHALNSGVTSGSQVQADQMQMNSALSTISRVVTTTRYGENNLLDGATDFSFGTNDAGTLLDAAGTSISSASGAVPSEVAVEYEGGAAAQAEKAYLEADFGGAETTQMQEFTVTGMDGSYGFSFAAGTTVEQMAEQINAMADSTGVNAYAVRDAGEGATTLRLASTEYGSDAAISVNQNTGNAFGAAGTRIADRGQDATVTVNGETVQTRGLTARVAGGGLNATVAFQEGTPGATSIAQTGYDQDELTNATESRRAALTEVKGGMQLQLGEGGGAQNRDNVSLGNYNPANLGTVVQDGETYSINDLYGGGAASLDRNPELALKIIDQAIADVSSGRANIGAYQANALDTNANNLMVALENTISTESAIRDADMADMMSMYIANQLLESAGLRGVQNQQMNAANVLNLLGGIGGGQR